MKPKLLIYIYYLSSYTVVFIINKRHTIYNHIIPYAYTVHIHDV